ncbi:MAG: amidohydrolase [Candidatus Neomarinimicrobiota bacterium]
MPILIKNVLLNDARKDILIEGNSFSKIANKIKAAKDSKIIDGENFAILPPFYNMHTHSAMNLLRAYSDDKNLDDWLIKDIFPIEKKLKKEDIYHGTRLAILEMIKSGTVYFNDMYYFSLDTAKAADEMGVRTNIALALSDENDLKKREKKLKEAKDIIAKLDDYPSRIKFSVGPHAIYTASKEMLQAAAQLAKVHNLPYHIHIAETKDEHSKNLHEESRGLTVVEYLDSIKVLSKNVIAAHCVHLSDKDRKILKKRKVTVVHCPASNMKLTSGAMDYAKLRKAGIDLVLGTDSASSNNNLSMLEEMKLAALQAKVNSGDASMAPAKEIYKMATEHGAKAAGLKAGKIEEAYLADCMLINLKHYSLTPCGQTDTYNRLISNMVYSASPECIDTLICDGRILMQDRKVNGEEEIIQKANEVFRDLISR